MTKTRDLLRKLINPFTTRHDSGNKVNKEESIEAIVEFERKAFQYDTLVTATRNFSEKLGEGGFGPVFKGLLEDGREVAVKRLAVGSRQGENQFANEASLLSGVQHKNVVHLYGFCIHGADRLLVYEYVANESIDKILFACSNDCPKRAELNWQRRYNIMLAVAKGLLYLHEGTHTPIIHRDIKAANILLDQRWVPKIADFGMARLFPADESHVNTRVVGTNGYMAPEYLMHGWLSPKADVYSFGVVVLELVTGCQCHCFVPFPGTDAKNLLEWAWMLYKERRILEMVDLEIRPTLDLAQVSTSVHIGLLCTQAEPKQRPDMRRISILFTKQPSTLEEPSRPGKPGCRYTSRPHLTSGTLDSSRNSLSSLGSGIGSSSYSTLASTSASASASSSKGKGLQV
ncbi:cysteine-rich RECEPTOR-like kinase [Rhynchospora pubera]|uniref:Cysteine-rich RECEPTOR-like kinase n=1 Tax=Rhynchospora pubera TaxID=906938 RepID=A0AAV8D7K5_9POAL|nr:cysteine-rich RECEPTOR-like kinase [Rhynchospora pubera]